ncbi:hypothetical protein ASG51_00940 [Methylobacterium sp. Leaf465]|uniref:hypothetical protein n=1 Tax=Methylobacterium sp. Leaf465 TaxID=1736385 RepID=UPI0006FE7560|nr:hypothetical protein [Methylobacterium sp. Leaf465]KQT84691.1 hypothetical protein ASG51_00940 [Methylobacterium sp. Leaf465]
MCLPADMRARVLRSTLDTVADEIRGADLTPALAARLNGMLADARRHAVDLEKTLRPVPAAILAPVSPRPSRRFVGHSEPGSNVIALRAG